MNPSDIARDLEMRLKPQRYKHTLAVMYTAASLAMCHGCEIKKAMLAGLLHDCSKNMSMEEHIDLCREAGEELTAFESANEHLLHSRTGAIYAQKVYGIEDPEILTAIRSHTTGRPEMSLLEKIIFVADYIEPRRKGLRGMDEVRQLAFSDLDKTVWKISSNTLDYLSSIQSQIDPRTIETCKYYERKTENGR